MLIIIKVIWNPFDETDSGFDQIIATECSLNKMHIYHWTNSSTTINIITLKSIGIWKRNKIWALNSKTDIFYIIIYLESQNCSKAFYS